MSRFGEILRTKREELGLTIQDVSKALRISQRYISALENGRFKELPSYFHCYGFAKNYINYLKLNEKEILDIFKSEYKRSIFEPELDIEEQQVYQEVNKDTNRESIKKRSLIYAGLSLLFIVLAIIFIYSFNKYQNNTDNVAVTKPLIDNSDNAVSNIIDNTADNNVSKNNNMDNRAISTIINDNNATPDNKAHQQSANKKVLLSFYNTCWINIRIDNKTELDFIAKPGFTKEFIFENFFIIDIGDASAIAIKYNSQTISGLGKPRQSIKNLYFTLEGEKLVYTKK
ncbi:MAG: DUF4115 domain-containing protein [Deferribacterales bacterium]